MSNTPEEKPGDGNTAAPDTDVTVQSRSEKVITHSTNRRTSRTAIVAIIAVVAITAVAIVAWMLWRSGSSGAGRPVPTPRNIGAEQPSSTASNSEETISIDPAAAMRA